MRNYINASRAKRKQIAEGKLQANAPDGRETFATQFDFDPVSPDAPHFPPRGAAPPPAKGAAPATPPAKSGGE